MITITKEVSNLLKDFNASQKEFLLKQTWNACCDGEVLSECVEDTEINPWDGNHEKLRLSTELTLLEEVIGLHATENYFKDLE